MRVICFWGIENTWTPLLVQLAVRRQDLEEELDLEEQESDTVSLLDSQNEEKRRKKKHCVGHNGYSVLLDKRW